MRAIVCIGNRYVREDAAGPLVHDRLTAGKLPAGVAVIDGGLKGLDLMPFLEGAECTVFVDALAGEDLRPGIHLLSAAEAARDPARRFDCAAGLSDYAGGWPYLLNAPRPPLPAAETEVCVVCVAGVPGPDLVAEAAATALERVLHPSPIPGAVPAGGRGRR